MSKDQSNQTPSVSDSPSSSGVNNLEPFPSVCFIFIFYFIHYHIFNFFCLLPQLPDAVVTNLRLSYEANPDAENSVTVSTPRDPYNFGHSFKTDAEIAKLRNRKRGKPLANYYQRQNAVRLSPFSNLFPASH
jgi:hypothetical protein